LITYAVVGHNEAALLANALEQALVARRPGEPVWFVDSASTDGSGELARSLGAELVGAPLGKGSAVATAVERCETQYMCVIDADLERTTHNVPATLREALERTGADQVVGEFEWAAKPFRPVTATLWNPLTGALFPEAIPTVPNVPLSGFRVFDVRLARAPLPEGFGLEVHLNIVGSLDGWRTATADIGEYWGTVRPNPGLPADIARAILDLGVARGRLSPEARPQWDEWLAPILQLIAETTPDDTERRRMLDDAAARPLPPTLVEAATT
jgi:glucosyl-3-phosphoglycerate synthase